MCLNCNVGSIPCYCPDGMTNPDGTPLERCACDPEPTGTAVRCEACQHDPRNEQ